MSGAQFALHLAQVAPHVQHVGTETLDGVAVAFAEDGGAGFVAGFQLGQLFLHFLQLLRERLLLLAIGALRVAPQIGDERERPVVTAAGAQRDQRF